MSLEQIWLSPKYKELFAPACADSEKYWLDLLLAKAEDDGLLLEQREINISKFDFEGIEKANTLVKSNGFGARTLLSLNGPTAGCIVGNLDRPLQVMNLSSSEKWGFDPNLLMSGKVQGVVLRPIINWPEVEGLFHDIDVHFCFRLERYLRGQRKYKYYKSIFNGDPYWYTDLIGLLLKKIGIGCDFNTFRSNTISVDEIDGLGGL